jgi:hypothetical protein
MNNPITTASLQVIILTRDLWKRKECYPLNTMFSEDLLIVYDLKYKILKVTA